MGMFHSTDGTGLVWGMSRPTNQRLNGLWISNAAWEAHHGSAGWATGSMCATLKLSEGSLLLKHPALFKVRRSVFGRTDFLSHLGHRIGQRSLLPFGPGLLAAKR